MEPPERRLGLNFACETTASLTSSFAALSIVQDDEPFNILSKEAWEASRFVTGVTTISSIQFKALLQRGDLSDDTTWQDIALEAFTKVAACDLQEALREICIRCNSSLLKTIISSRHLTGICLDMPLDDQNNRMLHILSAQDGSSACLSCIQLLLQQKVSISCLNNLGYAPIHQAVISGNSNAAKRYLDHDSKLLQARTASSETLLHLACRVKDSALARFLITKGHDRDPIDWSRYTPLHVCAENGCSEAVRLLLEKRRDAICVDTLGNTPLHIAARSGHADIVALFVDNGRFPIDALNNEGRSAFSLAAAGGYQDVLLQLRRKRAQYALADLSGKTALHYAVEHNRTGVVTLLLDMGATPIEKTKEGWTALHFAASKQDSALCAQLIKSGSQINEKNKKQHTALHIAIVSGRQEVVEFLLNNGADPKISYSESMPVTHLIYKQAQCARREHAKFIHEFEQFNSHCLPELQQPMKVLSLIALCLDKGALIDDKDRLHQTLLYHACHQVDEEMVQFCIERGASVTSKCISGWTPLHVAASKGSCAIAERLLERGALINEEEHNGKTALHLAVEQRHSDMVMLLLSHKAQVQSRDMSGRTPLHLLCQQGQSYDLIAPILDALIDQGADVSTGDCVGNTPLHLLHPNQHDAFIEKLVSVADTLDIADSKGFSPLAVACQFGRVSLIRTFFSHGANPQVVNQFGLKPLEMVPMKHNDCLLELFKGFAYLEAFFGKKTQESTMQNRYLYYGGMYLGTFLLRVGICSFLGMPLLAAPLEACSPSVRAVAGDMYSDYHTIRRELREQKRSDLAHALPKFVDDIYERQEQIQRLLQELRQNPDLLLMDAGNDVDVNPLEVAFLLGDFAFMQKLKERLQEKFETYRSKLQEKYQKLHPQLFQECSLYLNPAHLKLEVDTASSLRNELCLRLDGFRKEIIHQIASSLLRPLSIHRAYPEWFLELLRERLAYKLIKLLGTKIGIVNSRRPEPSSWDAAVNKVLDLFIPVQNPGQHEALFLGLFWASYNPHAVLTALQEQVNGLLSHPQKRSLVLQALKEDLHVSTEGEVVDQVFVKNKSGISTNCVERSYIQQFLGRALSLWQSQ